MKPARVAAVPPGLIDVPRPGWATPADVADADLEGAAAIIHDASGRGGHAVELDPAVVLGERLALAPPAGSRRTRLVRAADGWVAVNLARPEDVEVVPAWLRRDVVAEDPWPAIGETVRTQAAATVVDWGQQLGLPVSRVAGPDELDEQARHRGQRPPMAALLWTETVPPSGGTDSLIGRRVVDLTALWAGPLATSILAGAGCDVVKVESVHRPDGTRSGPAPFHDLLNHGKRSVALDLRTDEGRTALADLCASADLVATAARPRALRQLGLDPDRWRRHLAITGYGWTGPWADRVAFGDDAAAAGGVAALTDPPRLRGDAVADPAAGIFAAAAALTVLTSGASGRIDVALRDVVNHLLRFGDGWLDASPRARTVPGPARPLGADTDEVLGTMRGRP